MAKPVNILKLCKCGKLCIAMLYDWVRVFENLFLVNF